jgi:putative membrane protein insertion efficiency factor
MINSTNTSSDHWTEPVPSPEMSRGARVLRRAIVVYQRLTAGRPSPCRFYPSCSSYAHEAIGLHGAWRGTGLALRRLSRCRPLGPHGIDLVPELKKARGPQS